MWATIIIAESFTRIMGLTAGNVYSTIVAVVPYLMDPGWGGGRISYGGSPPPAGAGAGYVPHCRV